MDIKKEDLILHKILEGDDLKAIARSVNLPHADLCRFVRSKLFLKRLEQEGNKQLKTRYAKISKHFEIATQVFIDLALESKNERVKLAAAENLFKASQHLREIYTTEKWEKETKKEIKLNASGGKGGKHEQLELELALEVKD